MSLIPHGMTRRHFVQHLLGASAMTIPALTLGHSLKAHAQELKKNRKSAILLWMSGGPSAMDIWDLKPGSNTGGPFKTIRTSGDAEISEHMPLLSKHMHHMAIIRSMETAYVTLLPHLVPTHLNEGAAVPGPWGRHQ